MTKFHCLSLVVLLIGMCSELTSRSAIGAPSATSSERIANPSFEDGMANWGVFVPDESRTKGCSVKIDKVAPHSGSACCEMHADDFARFAVVASAFSVHVGERYRVTVWARADPSLQVLPGTPGLLLRLNLRSGNLDAEGGHYYVALNGQVARGSTEKNFGGNGPLPTQWTRTEVVVEAPAGADSMGPSFFFTSAKGTAYLDNFTIVQVDAATPLTPLVAAVTTRLVANTAGPAASPAATRFAPGPLTTDAQAIAALNLEAPGMGKVKVAVQGGNLAVIQQAYLDYRRTACPAKWKIMPSDQPAAATEADDKAGDEVCAHYVRAGAYDFPFPGADMGKDFNWKFNPTPKSDPAYTAEWTFCAIARTGFWQKLGDAYWKTRNEKYAVEWVAELEDFAAKNPLSHDGKDGDPALWRTLDAAGRVGGSWPYVYYHMLDSPSFDAKAQWIYLRSTLDHVTLLTGGFKDPNRSGNWVVAECSALYTVGVLFPECKDSGVWRDLATSRLIKEINRIVPPDGFEAELTPGYHYFSLGSFVGPLELAKLNNLTLPDVFASKITAMYRAPIWVMDQHGYTVATNDSGPYNVRRMAAETKDLPHDPTLDWAASGGKTGTQPPDSTMLPYAGFYALRGGWKINDFFLFFRAGPTGMGHWHEDMLEIVLRAWNKTLLTEVGTYPYDHSEWRRYDIGTASHSTIIVDDKWQHRGASNFPVTEPVHNPWVTTPVFDYVAGTYAGGYQLNVYNPNKSYMPEDWVGPVDHSVTHTRRILFLKPYYALVLDTVDGTGTHTIDADFHLDAPAAHIDPATQAAFSDNKDGVQLGLYPLQRDNLKVDIVQGQKNPMLGWFPEGHRPIPTVRFRKQQAVPAIFATLLYPYRNNAPAFSSAPMAGSGSGIWAQTLKLPREEAEIAIVKDGTSRAFSVTTSSGEVVQAEAAGVLRRRSNDGQQTYVGGWDLRSYGDGGRQFTLAAPGNILISGGANSGRLLFFNAGEKSVTLALTKPFALTATLAPGVWTAVTPAGQQAVATPPAFFPPLG